MTLGHKHGRGHASAHAHTLVPLLLVKPLTGGILLHELSLDMRGLSPAPLSLAARRRRGKVALVMSCVWGHKCVFVNEDSNVLLEKCSIAGCGNAFHHVCAGKVRFCVCACRHSGLPVLLRATFAASADPGGRRGSMRAVTTKESTIPVATHRARKAWSRLRSDRDPQEAPSPLRFSCVAGVLVCVRSGFQR